jgi:hypothetical protein
MDECDDTMISIHDLSCLPLLPSIVCQHPQSLRTLIHPLPNRLKLPARMFSRPAQSHRVAFESVQWRRRQVTVAHDGLPKTVEAMLQVCRLPIGAHKPRWQLLVLMVISAVAAVVQSLAELHADGIDAVQVVEHIRPARKAVSFNF